jgi:hypothetical protein
MTGKNRNISQHSENRWGIYFLHKQAAAASGIRAGLYGALDYSHFAAALNILTPVNLALTYLHGSPVTSVTRSRNVGRRLTFSV